MSIWSKLFGNPMKPIGDVIIKAVRQDGFGIMAYINKPTDRETMLVLQACQLEFLYFYISCMSQIVISKLDSRGSSKFHFKFKQSVIPQVINAIFNPDGSQRKRKINLKVAEDILNVEGKILTYTNLHAAQSSKDPHDVYLPLEFLAMRIANLSGNISDAEFQERLINVEFHEGVKNLVSYDLSRMDLDRLIEAAVKSI